MLPSLCSEWTSNVYSYFSPLISLSASCCFIPTRGIFFTATVVPWNCPWYTFPNPPWPTFFPILMSDSGTFHSSSDNQNVFNYQVAVDFLFIEYPWFVFYSIGHAQTFSRLEGMSLSYQSCCVLGSSTRYCQVDPRSCPIDSLSRYGWLHDLVRHGQYLLTKLN